MILNIILVIPQKCNTSDRHTWLVLNQRWSQVAVLKGRNFSYIRTFYLNTHMQLKWLCWVWRKCQPKQRGSKSFIQSCNAFAPKQISCDLDRCHSCLYHRLCSSSGSGWAELSLSYHGLLLSSCRGTKTTKPLKRFFHFSLRIQHKWKPRPMVKLLKWYSSLTSE